MAPAILGNAPSANLILLHGKVHSDRGQAQAIAIAGDRIVRIGTDADVARMKRRGTRIIDLKGATVLPGLTDSHVHVQFAGLEQTECRLPPGAGATVVKAVLARCVAAKPPGAWIRGGNWVAAAFGPGEQTRELLDAAAPANPVLLNDEAHHSVWVNGPALALAGITRTSPDPVGGIIDRGRNGEPTGLLREAATRLVEHIVPLPTLSERRAAVLTATTQMLDFGITAFTDATIRRDNLEAISSLSRDGLLKQTVRGCIVWAPSGEAHDMGEAIIAERARYEGPRFKLNCVKIFLDGVPAESRTAAMLEPYADASDKDMHPRGLLLVDPAALAAAVIRFDRMGLSVKFHAAGDAAVRAAIDAVAAAEAANGPQGPIHVVAHSSFVAPADIPRVAKLRMAWEFSPYIWYPTPIASVDISRAVGRPRMERWIPIREAMATGAPVVAGSDWSVVPSVNPWLGMETMVTRRAPGGKGPQLGAQEAVELLDAFRAFTAAGARLMGRDDAGVIREGAVADLIVTDRDPFAIRITEINKTRPLIVVVAGQPILAGTHP